jgi:hypothetical protein
VLKQGLSKIKSCRSRSAPRRRARARVPPEDTTGRGRTPPEPHSFPRPSRASRCSESAPRHAPARHPRRTGRTRTARPSGLSAAFPPSCIVLRPEPSRRRHHRSGHPYLRRPPFSSHPHRRSTTPPWPPPSKLSPCSPSWPPRAWAPPQ